MRAHEKIECRRSTPSPPRWGGEGRGEVGKHDFAERRSTPISAVLIASTSSVLYNPINLGVVPVFHPRKKAGSA